MSVSAEMYIVISLMFAVFAAVAAVGSSVVLGVGFERLRAGFEIVKKQTGFFADAIHKLDQHASQLDEKTKTLEESVFGLNDRVDSVEKQTGFFFESLTTLESKILKGDPKQVETQATPAEEIIAEPEMEKEAPQDMISNIIDWNATSETKKLLQATQAKKEEREQKKVSSHSLSSSLFNYLMSDNSENLGRIYH